MEREHRAEQIVWEAGAGVQMSLTPEPGGSLQVEVDGAAVTVHGKQCRHRQGEHAKRPKDVAHTILAEVHMTILTTHCLITWKSVAAAGQPRND